MKTFAATATTFVGAALISHGQADPAQQGGTTDAAAETQAQSTAIELKNKIQKWEDAESEEISKEELPPAAQSTLRNIAGEPAGIEDQVKRFTKGDQQVYLATVTREGEEDMKVFLRPDGGVEMTKQEATENEVPASVRTTVGEQTEGKSADEMYKVVADEEVFYVAALKGEQEGQKKMIVVSNTGEHIYTTTKHKSDDK